MGLTDQGEQGNGSESTRGQSLHSSPVRNEGHATDTGSTDVKDYSPLGILHWHSTFTMTALEIEGIRGKNPFMYMSK